MNRDKTSFRIVFTGPESSGKTTTVQAVSDILQWPWVPEVAREFLTKTHGQYDVALLLEMAEAQFNVIEQHGHNNDRFLCDTDILTYLIWQKEKYGYISSSIQAYWAKQKPNAYILCKPDIPWESDPLRENPHDRDRLFFMYEKYLKESHVPYLVLSGTLNDRVEKTLSFIERVMTPQQYN